MEKINILSILYFLVAIACLSACDTENDPTLGVEEKLEVSESDFSVSEEMARKVAVGFFTSDSTVLAARTNAGSVKLREVTKAKLGDEKSFEVFLINDQEGFIILSGDSRTMPVLAFSPQGSISVEDLREVNGLKLWFANTMEQIEDDLKEVGSVHPIVYGEWKKYTEDFDPRSRIWDYSSAISYNTNCYEWYQYGQFMCNPYFTLDQTGPLYSNNISWGQWGISSFYAPTHPIWTCPNNCGRSPVGCGAVAIAQTVWHYKRAQSFYSSMPQFSNTSCTPTTQGQNNLAFFLYQAAQEANTTFNFGGCNGMTLPSHIRPALTALGMQSNGSISTFDPHKLRNEIAQGHPAIFYGHDNIFTEWHTGHQTVTKSIGTSPTTATPTAA